VPREVKRLDSAVAKLRADLDRMLERGDVADVGDHRDVLEAYRMFANDQGWQHRLREAVATGLTAGTHTVTLMARSMDENQSRWTPPLVSSTTFLGFTVTGGALQASVRPTRPKIELLGDSITEGVNIWMSHNGQTRKCWRDDARIAYASQTAQMLGAEWRQVGFGYLGILKTGNGGVPKANDSFNWFYKDVPRDAWQADMVVVNEGTNDSGADAATFRTGYAQYLTTIRAAYPNAKLVALRPFNGSQAAPIKAEVDAEVDRAWNAPDPEPETAMWHLFADSSAGQQAGLETTGGEAVPAEAPAPGDGLDEGA